MTQCQSHYFGVIVFTLNLKETEIRNTNNWQFVCFHLEKQYTYIFLFSYKKLYLYTIGLIIVIIDWRMAHRKRKNSRNKIISLIAKKTFKYCLGTQQEFWINYTKAFNMLI